MSDDSRQPPLFPDTIEGGSGGVQQGKVPQAPSLRRPAGRAAEPHLRELREAVASLALANLSLAVRLKEFHLASQSADVLTRYKQWLREDEDLLRYEELLEALVTASGSPRS